MEGPHGEGELAEIFPAGKRLKGGENKRKKKFPLKAGDQDGLGKCRPGSRGTRLINLRRRWETGPKDIHLGQGVRRETGKETTPGN